MRLSAVRRAWQAPAWASGANAVVPNFVDGVEALPRSGAALDLFDAASGAVRGSVAASGPEEVDVAVRVADAARRSGPWATFSTADRCAVLTRAAALLTDRAEAFAAAESADTGKPLNLCARLDVPRAVANLEFFAGLALHDGGGACRHGHGDALNYSVRKPAGVVGLVTPWNLPLYLLTWKLAPALVTGNGVVAKPSEVTPTTASLLAGLMVDAGLPAGVFNVVHGGGAGAGAPLAGHAGVDAVSFTGGTATGAAVAALAAPRFAKLSLEMGGKNPAVVFADCDLDLAVDGVCRAAFLNSGQICLCPERILVERTDSGFHEEFSARLAARAASLVVGDPADPKTDCGPLVSLAQRDKARGYAALAVEEGGTILAGGPSDARLEGLDPSGYWFPPTVVAGAPADGRAATEEVFGPLVSIHTFDDDAGAVALANDSAYGLAASVWTENVSRAHAVAGALEAGTVWVNCWLHRELHMPFGGVKDSGVNREGGTHSLDFYSEISTVCVKLGDRTPPPMPGLGARA